LQTHTLASELPARALASVAHIIHALDPAREIALAGHALQSVDAVMFWYVPASQKVQATAADFAT